MRTGLITILKDNLFWWLRQLILIALGGFFVFFGVQILLAAYRLNDPFSFILTFFAANLIILISAVLVVGFVYRAFGVYTRLRMDIDEQKP